MAQPKIDKSAGNREPPMNGYGRRSGGPEVNNFCVSVSSMGLTKILNMSNNVGRWKPHSSVPYSS